MKKLSAFTWLVLMVLLIITSCSKDKELLSPDSLNQQGDKMNNLALAKGIALTPIEQLGKSIYFDKISVPNSMACADCHAPSAGFTGPMAGFNIHGSVYRGADAQNFGNRKPPSAAYATLSPVFHYDAIEELFIGGNFWDGRATGEHLGNPAAEQALGPFLNPAEHNVPDKQTVLMKIAKSKYASLWIQAWEEPLKYTTEDEIILNYDRVGLSIAAYEGSAEVNQFTSKFDFVQQGLASFTPQEAWGLELFNSEEKGKCALCHLSDGKKPLFTDFTFDNLGVPKNPENPVYKNDPGFIDPGFRWILTYEGRL
jgi:cytochrome c peroxidase